MNETSEQAKRFEVRGVCIYFDGDQLIEAVEDDNGLASLEIDGEGLQKLNTALAPPACGVLTEEERKMVKHLWKLFEADGCCCDLSVGFVCGGCSIIDNLLDRSTQQGDAMREVLETEQARWQKAIYELCTKSAGEDAIDGSGCESGDPLDVSLAEISQTLAVMEDRLHEAQQGESVVVRREDLAAFWDWLSKVFGDGPPPAWASRLHDVVCEAKRAEAALAATKGE